MTSERPSTAPSPAGGSPIPRGSESTFAPSPALMNAETKESNSDTLIVTWDGPDDPENPKNWTYAKKWRATIIVSIFTFISPVSSSMVAPASTQLAQDFGITDEVLISMCTSIFVLAYAFGPLFLGPLSEIYGRMRILQFANLFYIVWNLVCGFAQNEAQLLVFRLLAGIGGSAPLAVGGGLLGDIFSAEQRGRAIAIYSMAPLLGPVVGPVCGGWIAEKSTWRWVFWATSIAAVLVQLAGLVYLRETYAPYILGKKAERIRKEQQRRVDAGEVEKGGPVYSVIRSQFDASGDRTIGAVLKRGLSRPFMFIGTQQVIQVFGLYIAFIYGLLYLFLTTIPGIFEGVYKQSTGIASLHYIALGIGITGASQVNARLMDKMYQYLKEKRGNGKGQPEFRIPSMIPGVILTPIGLLIAGWTARADVHWIACDIGIALVGAGTILNFQGIQVYVIDCFTLHAASALAAVSFLRSLCGFGFPLFATYMYDALGYGWGCTILACCSIVIGGPAPFIFWKYGPAIRQKSKWMAKNVA